MIAPSVGRGKGSLAQLSLSDRLSRSITRYVEPAAEWLAKLIIDHWLFIANAMLFVFIALPFAAPIFEALGLLLPAKAIFTAYRLTCHQLPDRSFFVMGHQVAICSRCSAIYLSFWGVGLFYALGTVMWPRRAPVWKSPPLWAIAVAAIPMAVDGLTQLSGLRESTNLLRTITGGLPGSVAAIVMYPYMHSGFKQARQVWETGQVRWSSPTAGRGDNDE